jgi:hypothetical protein
VQHGGAGLVQRFLRAGEPVDLSGSDALLGTHAVLEDRPGNAIVRTARAATAPIRVEVAMGSSSDVGGSTH